jgi:NitT/TauT family transport system substrate-binding protein
VKLYGNVIIASPKLIRRTRRGEGLPARLHQGREGSDGQPGRRDRDVKARDGIINTELETRRLKHGDRHRVNSPTRAPKASARSNPGRLSLMASQVSDAFGTKTRVNPDAVWNGASCRRRRS